MGLDDKFMASLLDCMDGKKSKDTVIAIKAQLKSLLANGVSKDDKLLLADIYKYLDKKPEKNTPPAVKEARKLKRKEIYNTTKELVERMSLERSEEVKLRHSSGTIGAGAMRFE